MGKSIFKNVIYKVLLNIFNIIIPLIIGPYANRVLGPKLVGRINYVDSIYNYFLVFGAFGIYNYGLREVSRIRENKVSVSRLFTNLFVIGFLTNIITSVAYFFFIILKFRYTSIFPIFFIYGISILSNIFYVEWATEGIESYNFITIKSIIIRLIYIVFLFILVKSSKNVIEYVSLLAISLFLNNLVSFIYISKKIKFQFKQINILPHIKYLLIVLIMANANVLYTQFDRIMLGSFVGEEAVGYYGVAQNVMSMSATLMLSIVMVTIPRLSNVLSNNNEKEYESLLNMTTKAYFTILFPAVIGMFILSKEIILFYGGVNFIESVSVLKIFSLYMAVSGIESVFTNQIIYVKRKEKILFIFIFAYGILNLILKLTLVKIHLLNASSAIASSLISDLLLIITEYIYIKNKLKTNINILSFEKIKYLFISLIFIPITLIIRNFVSNVILTVLLSVTVNIVIYFGILYIIKDSLVMLISDKLKIPRRIKTS
jgi:O-antigen/teichoic acid export membrane protein